MPVYRYEDLTIYPCSPCVDDMDKEAHSVDVEVSLSMGDDPEFEVEEVQIILPQLVKPVIMTEEQFVMMFPDGQDIINNAYEYASVEWS